MPKYSVPTVELIPVDQVEITNPRARSKKGFKEIIENIAELGLEKPITVTKRDRPEGTRYDLVCGQGRLEAYKILGQREIPALIVEADSEDCLESLIDRFVEQLDQVFMLRVFHVDTIW